MKSQFVHGAFILARYSTEHQKEDSIEVQVDACRAWCQKNKIPVLGVFADMGVSGMKRTRPEYSRMMEQLRAGMADTVVIYDQSRMFRRMSAWFDFRAEIDRLGVRVVSVTQTQIGGDLRDPAIFLMESSSAMFNQMWALQTRQKVVAKMRWMAQQGQFTGGVPPLGYKKEDGRLVIDEAEAAVVRVIFALYADGVSYREITRRLNAEGHFTRSGRPFGSNSIHDLLRNVKYIGIMRYGNVVRDDDGHRNSHSHDGDVIEIEGAVPAIVDLKTWERVQAKMDENRRAQAGRPASVRDYPLKGKVFCLECGASMSVSCSTSHGKKHFYYRCSGRKRRDDCDNSPIRCDTLEHRVAEVVRQILADPENLNGLFAVLREERGQVQDNASARLAALSSRRGDLDAQIRNATDAILAGLNSPALAERLHCLEDERAQLEHDIKQLRGAVKGSEISEAALLETLRQIRDTPDGEAALLAAVVRVEVGKEEIRVWTLLDADPDGHFDFSSADDNGLVIKIPHVRPPAPEKHWESYFFRCFLIFCDFLMIKSVYFGTTVVIILYIVQRGKYADFLRFYYGHFFKLLQVYYEKRGGKPPLLICLLAHLESLRERLDRMIVGVFEDSLKLARLVHAAGIGHITATLDNAARHAIGCVAPAGATNSCGTSSAASPAFHPRVERGYSVSCG